jgi:hypothetical protein
MTMLRDLLATWENWSARDILTGALGHAPTETPEVSALDALRDSTELVELLTTWQWQAMHAARCEGNGWAEIALAAGTTVTRAKLAFEAALERMDLIGADTTTYRSSL